MISKVASDRRLRLAFDDTLAPDSHVLDKRKHLHGVLRRRIGNERAYVVDARYR